MTYRIECPRCNTQFISRIDLRGHTLKHHTQGVTFMGRVEGLHDEAVPGEITEMYDIDTWAAADAAAHELDAHLKWEGSGMYVHVLNSDVSNLTPVAAVVRRIDQEIDRLNLLRDSLEDIS